jgi:beta-N-acetylhexosaminidase
MRLSVVLKILLVLLASAAVLGCYGKQATMTEVIATSKPDEANLRDSTESLSKKPVLANNITSDSITTDEKHRLRAAQIADSMDIKTLAAQVILTAIEGKATLTERTRKLLADFPAGGIILFGYNFVQNPEENREFIEKLSNYMTGITLPPFIASDQEGGAVQRIKGKAELPSPLSYWEKLKNNNADTVISAIEQEAGKAGLELRRIGVTLNLAPLVEILTANNKSFLKNRSYGPEHVFTVNASAAFIRGMESARVASTLKHFPGSSSIDPHYHKTVMAVSEAELEVLLEPFRELIRRETPASIMVSHIIIPSWDTIPLTRSPVAVKYLREIGFTGIIIADDFAMVAAGTSPEVAVVEALAAGVDMIIAWPKDIQKIYAAILNALESGILSQEQVKKAAKQVIYQKIRYGIVK